MKSISAPAVLVALLISTHTVTAQEKLESKAKLLADVTTVFNGMCADYQRQLQQAAGPTMTLLVRDKMEIWCSCAPAEMGRLAVDLSDPMPRKAILDAYTQATSICTGRQMRASTMAACPTDQDAIARANNIGAYCACVGSRLTKMGDQQLQTELDQAYHQEQLQTKASGKPLPYLETFALRKFGAGCETAAISGVQDSALKVGTK